MIVDALFHTAEDLNLVHGFHAHAEVFLNEPLVDDGTADTHAHRADLEIALPAHCSGCHGCTPEPEQLFADILRNIRHLIAFLHLMTVDTERRQTLLCVGGENGREIDRTRTLRTVEAPHALDGRRIHVHRFRTVAPARRNGQSDLHALSLELFGTRGGFRNATDGGIGKNDLHVLAVGIVEVFLKELLCRLCHRHNLSLQAFAELHRTSASIHDGTDADDGVRADISVFCHNFVYVLSCNRKCALKRTLIENGAGAYENAGRFAEDVPLCIV